MTRGKTITVQTQGFSDIVNITEQVQTTVTKSSINQGMVSITATITTQKADKSGFR